MATKIGNSPAPSSNSPLLVRSIKHETPPKAHLAHSRACSTPTGPVELCPPHWRRRTPSLRTTIKAIVLKLWPQTRRPITLHPRSTRPLRPAMRMKDSDDYITARAANPWTGVVSPSIGTPSPCTPGSPGDALRLSVVPVHISPTPITPTRPHLSRANEGRKVNAGSGKKRHAEEKGWGRLYQHTTPAKEFSAVGGADRVLLEPPVHLKDDQFIVHMPSAREPQPYAHPGRTPEQIIALEYSKNKTSLLSNSGYNHPQPRRIPSSETRGISACDTYAGSRQRHVETQKLAPPVDISNRDWNISEARSLGRPRKVIDGQELGKTRALNPATIFPHTPPYPRVATLSQTHGSEHAGRVDMHAALTRDMRPASTSVHHSAPRPCSNTCNRAPCHEDGPAWMGNLYPDKLNDTHKARLHPVGTDLTQLLPRVQLVRPELAALPRATDLVSKQFIANDVVTACNDMDAGHAIASGNFIPYRNPELSCDRILDSSEITREELELPSAKSESIKIDFVIELVISLIKLVHENGRHLCIRYVPRIASLEVLTSSEATSKQKVEALKSLSSVMGQIVLFAVAGTLMWQVGSIVMALVDVVLIPLRVLVWLVGS